MGQEGKEINKKWDSPVLTSFHDNKLKESWILRWWILNYSCLGDFSKFPCGIEELYLHFEMPVQIPPTFKNDFPGVGFDLIIAMGLLWQENIKSTNTSAVS